MSDTIFYSIFATLFGAALCLQVLLCYNIGMFAAKPKVQYRTILIDIQGKKCDFCSIDDNDWKELKAEPL